MKVNPVHGVLSHAAVMSIRGLGAVVKILPPVFWGALASALTPFLWLVLSTHRRRTLKNLMDTGRSRTQACSLGLACFRSNLLVFFESLAMKRIIERRGVRVERRISANAEKTFRRTLDGKEPIVIGVSGHVGVWELMGAETANMLAPTTVAVSARRAKNPVFNDYLVGLRKSYGMDHIDKEVMIRYVIKMIRKKVPHVYVFLCDQHFRRGEKIPFMKKNACTVSMPAILAIKYNCPLFMGRCIRRAPGDYLIEIDLLDLTPYTNINQREAVRLITTEINAYIAASIEKAPEQWTWGHRRWRSCCEEDPRKGLPSGDL
mgnify:FL=1